MSHIKQELNVPTNWKVQRNEFYDIDPFDNSSADDKYALIFVQEDMLWLKKDNYNIDMGWYDGDEFSSRRVSFAELCV